MAGLVSNELVQVRPLGPVDIAESGVSSLMPRLRRKSVLAAPDVRPGEVITATVAWVVSGRRDRCDLAAQFRAARRGSAACRRAAC